MCTHDSQVVNLIENDQNSLVLSFSIKFTANETRGLIFKH